jgi:hypothetical protein
VRFCWHRSRYETCFRHRKLYRGPRRKVHPRVDRLKVCSDWALSGLPNVFYPRFARSWVLHELLDCNPCDQIHCVRQNSRCIDQIGLAEVQLAVNEVLDCSI